jgi:hypothetical protein
LGKKGKYGEGIEDCNARRRDNFGGSMWGEWKCVVRKKRKTKEG